MSKIPTSFPEDLKIYTSSLKENSQGVKRIWLEANRLKRTAFTPGEGIIIETEPGKVTIRQALLGIRQVSQRRGKPLIDIQNKTITKALEGAKQITIRVFHDRIEVTPLKEGVLQRIAREKAENPITFVELCAGGSTLTEAFKSAGFKPVAAVELEDKYLETYEENNPETMTYCTSLQLADWSLLPDADMVVAGIPCDKWCPQGKAKAKDTGEAVEEASDTGYLAYYFLEVMRLIRPGFGVIEEVVAFAQSAIAAMVRNVLIQMGYHITEAVLNSFDMGGLTKRTRYCMVASMKGPVELPASAKPSGKRIRDILEIPPEKRKWETAETSKSIATFLRRERENQEPGAKRNFGVGRVRLDDTIAPTVTKHYTKKQPTQPILYDEVKDAYSFLTKRELARLNGLPDTFKLPSADTTACEIIGQGVCNVTFGAVANAIKAA